MDVHLDSDFARSVVDDAGFDVLMKTSGAAIQLRAFEPRYAVCRLCPNMQSSLSAFPSARKGRVQEPTRLRLEGALPGVRGRNKFLNEAGRRSCEAKYRGDCFNALYPPHLPLNWKLAKSIPGR